MWVVFFSFCTGCSVRTHVCTLACVHTLDACFYQVAWVDTRPPSSSAAFGPEPGPRRLTRGSWQQTRRRISSAQILKEVAFRAACQRRSFPPSRSGTPGDSVRPGKQRTGGVFQRSAQQSMSSMNLAGTSGMVLQERPPSHLSVLSGT